MRVTPGTRPETDIDAGETDAGETSAHRIEGEADPLLVVTDGAPGLIAGADPRRNGDDYPMTSLSDGLGPQKDPNSGRTRVESGPAGTHRPTTRRGSGIAQPSVPRARCPECLARRGCGPARAIVTPDAPPAIAARGSACP